MLIVIFCLVLLLFERAKTFFICAQHRKPGFYLCAGADVDAIYYRLLGNYYSVAYIYKDGYLY